MLVESLAKNYENTHICITVKTFQEHRAHMVGPLTVCLGFSLAVTCISFNSDARRSPKPKIHRMD